MIIREISLALKRGRSFNNAILFLTGYLITDASMFLLK